MYANCAANYCLLIRVGWIMFKKLYVGNFPTVTTEKDLMDKFQEFGLVETVEIIRNQDTGQSSGCGFIEMSSRAEADLAINKLNFTQYGDRTLSVRLVRSK